MGYPPLEELLPKSGHSMYKLVRMTSLRAAELADGRRPLVDLSVQHNKLTTIALEEIRAGKIVLAEVADQFPPPDQRPETQNDDEEETE